MRSRYLTKKYYKEDEFYRLLFTIAIPIIIQNFLSSSLNMVDNLMIGRLGEDAIAAVGQANQLFFLFNLMIFGLNSGGAIFFSQYHGNHDERSMTRFIGITLALGGIIALLFSVVAIFFPQVIMGLYTEDPLVLTQSTVYLRIVGFSYLISSFSFTMVFALRSTGQAFVPMLSSIIGLGSNTVLNFLLINGYLGFPRLEVRGAAIATLVARIIEFSILLYMVWGRKKLIRETPFQELLRFRKADVRRFLSVASPVIINETFWSLGIMTYNFAIAQIGVSAFAALQITNTIAHLFLVFAFGVCNAASIIIGNQIGKDRLDLVKEYTARIIRIILLLGGIMTLALLLFKGPILGLYKLEGSTHETTNYLLTMTAFIIPVRFMNILYIVGIFRGGGDTKYSLMAETLSLWGVGVPLVAVSALVLGMPVEVVFTLSLSEELVKLVICTPRYRSMKWIRKVI